MVGIPDGLGARPNGPTFSLLMNHELTVSAGSSGPGIVRAHDRSGAFVSKWTIDRKTLRVIEGADFTQSPEDVYCWDPATNQYQQSTTRPPSWSRAGSYSPRCRMPMP